MRQGSGIIGILAENVRRRRAAAGLSQENLALEAGLDRTYISQVERGKRNVTIEVLARLAAALDTTADQLLVPQKKARGSRG
jgi:transcriptional regulator with XRE-family HTH domain